MNPEFIKSINTAEASDGEFFIVNFGAKSEIKIFFEKTLCIRKRKQVVGKD